MSDKWDAILKPKNESQSEAVTVVPEQTYEEPAQPPVVYKPQNQLGNVTKASAFSDTVDDAKIRIVSDASENDEQFKEKFKNELKEAALKAAQLEKEKQILEKQNIEYHQELLETKQQANQHVQKEDKWINRQKKRQYHYDGLKPVLEVAKIKTPMAIPIMYFFFIVLLIPFLVKILFSSTVGALVSGVDSEDRGKAIKGFMWTLLALICVAAIILLGYLTLTWLKLI